MLNSKIFPLFKVLKGVKKKKKKKEGGVGLLRAKVLHTPTYLL